jgi:hypothetical protein
MASIIDLYKAIKKIDLYKSPFEGASYDLTYNDTLGLPKVEGYPDVESFTVLAPFPRMPKQNEDKTFEPFKYKAGKMPIEEAFKAVLKKGVELSKDQDSLFIDIADLDQENSDFFREGGYKPEENDSVAIAMGTILNDESLVHLKPIVRFLRGTPDQIDDNFGSAVSPSSRESSGGKMRTGTYPR